MVVIVGFVIFFIDETGVVDEILIGSIFFVF